MFDIERFLEEHMNPVFRAYYSLWVLWWPTWRKFTGGSILRHWESCSLIKDGDTFLDYGCGTGDFTLHAAKKVSESGKVYALDYFPRQLEIVSKRTAKAGLSNVETILSSGHTGLPDESVDVVWMCDVLHEIKDRRTVIKEMHRILKRNGALAIYDAMEEQMLPFTHELFALNVKENKLHTFTKI